MRDPQEKSVALTIRNEIPEFVLVSQSLEHLAEDVGVPSKALIQLQIVLDELLSNIVKYAWPANESHEIKIHIKIYDGVIEIAIMDDGAPFNPCQHPPRQLQAPGARPRPGGVGIHLVKQLVDDIKYARIGERNQVVLTKTYVAQRSKGNM